MLSGQEIWNAAGFRKSGSTPGPLPFSQAHIPIMAISSDKQDTIRYERDAGTDIVYKQLVLLRQMYGLSPSSTYIFIPYTFSFLSIC